MHPVTFAPPHKTHTVIQIHSLRNACAAGGRCRRRSGTGRAMLPRASSVPLLLSRSPSLVHSERARRLALQSECERLDREDESIAAELDATRRAIHVEQHGGLGSSGGTASDGLPAARLPRQTTVPTPFKLNAHTWARIAHRNSKQSTKAFDPMLTLGTRRAGASRCGWCLGQP